MSTQASSPDSFSGIQRFPLLALLHPREQTRAVLLTLALGLLVGGIAVWLRRLPLWGATTLVLGLLLVPGILKWRADLRLYGPAAMVLSILLVAQGFHTVEHLTQVIQYHFLHWPMRASSGLISAANSEWIHFIWNWTIVLITAGLIVSGMRNFWAWLLLAWAFAHASEHLYMFVRYLEMLRQLQGLGFPALSAQGLPGILGRDGWLATNPWIQASLLHRLPGLTTAPRLDIHFWWNVGETTLMFLAAHTFLRKHLRAVPESHG
jgi:hypothetical protein